jgi:Flp pilus assembly protein TadD
MPRMHLSPAPTQALRAAALAGALAALEAGRLDVAESQAAPWSARDPADREAALILGLALAARGDATRAAPLLHRAARPGFAHPCRDLAQLRPNDPATVAAQFRASRALAPKDTGLAYAQADFLLNHGDTEAALAILRPLTLSAPRFGPAHNLLGMALLEHGDAPSAIASLRRATRLDPGEGAPWTNLGMALKVESRFGEAIAAHDQAVVLAPNDPRIRLNRAIALLRAGRMAEAWPDYEFRLAASRGLALPPEKLLPDIATAPLAGRTILAWHEEGFGDTLQFCRYLPMLAATGARVLARLPRELTRLLAQLPGITILPQDAPIPAFDFHIPVFSLPRAFATTLETIPAAVPYLRADPALTAAWAQKLPAAPFRIGIVWAGQARPWLAWFTSLDRRRSMTLRTLAPLADLDCASLVSLQMGAPAQEARDAPFPLHDPTADITDFADTAAIIENLDAVVSVDTSVLHLAAAMGKPVLLLDRYDSCWRWLSGRENSPWYPTLRILRQQTSGDWPPVVRRAAALLAKASPSPRNEAGRKRRPR